MIVKSGNFQFGNDRVFYGIDERLTDGVIMLNFFIINGVYRYDKRKMSYIYDVKYTDIQVKPLIQRDIEEFEKFIEEFFKENYSSTVDGKIKIYHYNGEFSCDLFNNKTISCDSRTMDMLNEKIFKSGFKESELFDLLLSKSVSGYRR